MKDVLLSSTSNCSHLTSGNKATHSGRSTPRRNQTSDRILIKITQTAVSSMEAMLRLLLTRFGVLTRVIELLLLRLFMQPLSCCDSFRYEFSCCQIHTMSQDAGGLMFGRCLLYIVVLDC